jgi:hypothetical protein
MPKAPNATISELITVTDLGRGGAWKAVLQKGQKLLTNQRLLPQLGQFMVRNSALASAAPSGLGACFRAYPKLKHWAILSNPFGIKTKS